MTFPANCSLTINFPAALGTRNCPASLDLWCGLNPQNAWTVKPSVHNFAAAIREALNDPELRAAKTLAAAQEYCWEKVTSSFLDLYSELQRTAHAPLKGSCPALSSSTRPAVSDAILFHGVSRAAETIYRAIFFPTLTRGL